MAKHDPSVNSRPDLTDVAAKFSQSVMPVRISECFHEAFEGVRDTIELILGERPQGSIKCPGGFDLQARDFFVRDRLRSASTEE